jgi:hypothetical protein
MPCLADIARDLREAEALANAGLAAAYAATRAPTPIAPCSDEDYVAPERGTPPAIDTGD